ncbi:MAG: aldo/keto reductase [Bacilli bacterium]
MEYVTLNNGIKMPILGYGVYQVSKEDCKRCVLAAIECGYRLIDTAQSYFNEEQVGEAVKECGIPREELFITTKVWIQHYGYDECRKSVLESLRKLQLDYVDLVLLHQPFADYYGAYRALEDLYKEGKIRAIGISNFYPDRFVDLQAFVEIKPMVNQIEVNPYNQQIVAQKWADKYSCQLEAWAPFAEGRQGIFENKILSCLGKKYNKSNAQIILRWLIQRGIVVIPKSTHKERIKENFEVFDFVLSKEDMLIIENMDKKTSSFFSHQDPNMVEWFIKMVEERKNMK